MVIDFVPAYYQNFELIALMKSVQPQLTMVTDFELTVLMKSEKQIHEKQKSISVILNVSQFLRRQ